MVLLDRPEQDQELALGEALEVAAAQVRQDPESGRVTVHLGQERPDQVLGLMVRLVLAALLGGYLLVAWEILLIFICLITSSL